ncbi:MAG: acyl-CoA thioesterase [Vicinamibacterales bacterium]
MAFYWVLKKVHWSDGDAAGIARFPNYFRWFEDAEEELFANALGRSRQALLDAQGFGMPRVEAHITYQAPVRIGTLLRVGLDVRAENPRRLRHVFEMRDSASDRPVAAGFVRVGCVSLADFAPRDFPDDIAQFVQRIQSLAAAQADGAAPVPWA